MIPAAFAEQTIAREGAPGRTWIEHLPGLTEHHLGRWRCTPTGPAVHGQVALIVPALRDGARVVLKLSFPHPGNRYEPTALAAWSGAGAVRLLERDDADFAMLLERISGETLSSATDDPWVVAGELARRLAVPAPPEIPRLTSTLAGWSRQMLAQSKHLGNPLPARLIDAALETIAAFGDDKTDTMLHGDLHFANVLRADREPWLVIDPKGLAGSAAFDAATIVRDRIDEIADDLSAGLLRRIATYSEAAAVDRDLSRRATQARAVSSALWERLHHQPRVGIDLADQIAEALV
ncbi:aminoglycoside phosphotransferase family protein [Kribbella italica]|uniref:Streptomycin 6-kinase n=1 Tax=Kribbella italica TaxID=1540520 RepID=A0A7W9MXC2_9ACTN|nr:streptomycin 6-kinase [Kribbella italica]